MNEYITRRSAIKRLLGISGAVACSALTEWPWGELGFLWAEDAGGGFIVEGRGRTEGYSVKELINKVFDAAGGITRFISRGDVVAIKPNISWARSPAADRTMARNSHPRSARTPLVALMGAG